MAYWQWGRDDAPHVLVCVHGLSRQGRDFDVLARNLLSHAGGEAGDMRIVCPDVAGRGQSEWLVDPMGYQIPLYAMDMVALLQVLKP
ncbi:alpha/beta fold hydrolase, partial [Leptospira sp. SA-E8]|uniref:alpha/beta fold hydrolase n=1 Tax=Leptospira sp. SA-E8 TaxID=3422259 RepID=UPI003EBD37D4